MSLQHADICPLITAATFATPAAADFRRYDPCASNTSSAVLEDRGLTVVARARV
jgi:hypothetical protein